MAQNAAFNVSLVFKAEVEAAKAGIEAIKRELGTVGAATTQAAKTTEQNATAIDREAEATARATREQESYAAAARRAETARRSAQAAPTLRAVPQALPGNLSGIEPGLGLSGTSSAAAIANTALSSSFRLIGADAAAAREEAALYGQEIEAVRARYNPLFAASRRYEQELHQIAEAEKIGWITAREASSAREAAAARMAPVTAGMSKLGAATKLTSWEMRGLTIQASDTFQSLALGMPALQVLLQQGPQAIDQIGGIGRALTLLKSALTLPRVAAGAATVVGLLGAKSWNDYLKSTKEVATAASGLGRAVAGSASEMEAAAQTGARAAGISVGAARSMEASFLRTGKIGHENFAQLIGITRDFGATMGISASAAGDALAEMMRDPAKAADQLSQQYGLIDAKTAEHARNLAAQNRLTEAQSTLLDGLRGNLASATEATTGWARAWETVGTAAANAWDKVGGAIDGVISGQTPEERIAQLQSILSRSRVRGRDAYQAELDRLLAEQARKQDEAEQARANVRGTVASAAADASPVNATAKRMQELRNRIALLSRGLEGDTGISDGQRARITADLEARTRILGALENRQERQADLDRLDIQIQTERNPLLRAELEARRTRLEMADQEIATSEIGTAADRARNQVIAQTIAAAGSQASALSTEAAIREQLTAKIAAGAVAATEADAWMTRELTMRPLIAAAALAEGAEKADLEAQIRKLGAAYDGLAKARREAATDSDARASKDRIADLALETALIGQSSTARIRAQAAAAAERWIRDQGLSPSSAEAEAKRARAAAEAEAQIRRDSEQRARELRQAKLDAESEASARLAATPLARADIEAEREYARVLAESGDAQEAAARADLIRSQALSELRGALVDYARTQQEQIARTRLEAALAGQSASVQAQALAAYEAELFIRRQGLDIGSAEAAQLRERARLSAEVQLETARVTEAWEAVGKAGETAIDGIVGALRKGDLGGAVQAITDQISGILSELAITNPLKNALLGTSYGTLNDAGGLGGIWDRLTGKAPAIDPAKAASTAAAQAMSSVATMQVTAATVILGGAGTAQLLGSAGADALAGANLGAAPLAANSGGLPLGGSGAVQSQVWQFFAQKGLQPHQISGIMGNLSAESGFNPLAVGDAGQAFGLAQWNDRKGKLFDAIGGRANLGDVQAQLEYLWSELNSTEGAAFKKLLAASDVRGATEAFAGFERPSGWSAANPAGAMHFDRRLAAAEAALTKFTSTTATAATDLGTLGNGFDSFGAALANGLGGLASGGASGGMTSFFGTLGTALASAWGLPGFATGGATGGSDPSKIAGIVHEREYVFDAASTARIGVANLEAMRRGALRGYASGGYVTPANLAAPINPLVATGAIRPEPSSPMRVVVNNYGRDPVAVEETTDARGERQLTMTIGEQFAAAATQRGNPARQALDAAWATKNRTVRR